MSTKKSNASEALAAQRIKVGDKINGHVVTEKVWTRDTVGNCKVHVVYLDGNREDVVVLDPDVSFAMALGMISTNEVFDGKRVQTDFSKVGDDWRPTQSNAEMVDITTLSS
ncbi:hypothetical protein [Pseudomonas soli]|uniref:hypothetical protein n=1 Tax=Pseudomonas soli TaxID=1306993 RepID=UPI00380FB569